MCYSLKKSEFKSDDFLMKLFFLPVEFCSGNILSIKKCSFMEQSFKSFFNQPNYTKSPLITCLLQTIENHRTPMKIKYFEINTNK